MASKLEPDKSSFLKKNWDLTNYLYMYNFLHNFLIYFLHHFQEDQGTVPEEHQTFAEEQRKVSEEQVRKPSTTWSARVTC